ncbi:hypothetical protein Tco_0532026 [Tanacetum coccineum]
MDPPLWKKRQILPQQTEMQMYQEVERMYRNFSLLIHHGGSFRKFPNSEYRGGYDSVDEPMYYHYFRPMTDLDVGLLALGSDEDVHSLTCLISNVKIRATIKEYHKDIGVEASSASPKKNELLMLEWYDNTTPMKASSNTRSMTPKSIPHGLFIHACDETIIPVGYLSDLPLPFDLNIPTYVSTDEGIVSDHADVQNRLDEELGNVNEPDDVNHASVNEDNYYGNTTRVDEHLDNDNAPLENAALIGEDIHNYSEYDAESSENEEANDYDEVMIDEENEIHKAKVEVYLFSLRDSDYSFTNIEVSSKMPNNVFMEKDRYEMDIDDFNTDSGGEDNCAGGRRSAFNKLKKAFMEDRVYLHSIETRKELKLVRNDKLRVRASCFSKTHVYSTTSHSCENEFFVGPYGSKGPNNRQRNKLSAWADADVGGEINGKAATTTVAFERCMNELKSLNVRAHDWLNKITVELWSRAHFLGRAHTNILLNNLCEVFNVKIVGGRDKLVITLLEYIREYCIKRIMNVQAIIDICDGPLTPTATRILDSIKKQAMLVMELVHVGNGNSLGSLASMSLSTWKEVYSHKVKPINGSNNWVKTPCPTTILPPSYCVPIGRPKKKRARSLCEKDEMVKNGNVSKKEDCDMPVLSQAVVSQADMVGSQAFGSQVDMVGSQAFGSQENGIRTQTNVAGSGNRVNSVQGGLAHGSAHGSAQVDDNDDDDYSSVEEMSPVKKPSKRASRAKKNDAKDKEPAKD